MVKHRKRKITKRFTITGAACLVAIAMLGGVFATIRTRDAGASHYTPAPRTKVTGCATRGGLEDMACTPGAVFANATKDQICKPGYAGSVRNVPESEKDQVYAEYGITSHIADEYEVDHLISLELGGSNDIANLWPEATGPGLGSHQKDQVENYLHRQVCDGRLSLKQAQEKIATDWLKVYQGLDDK